jgi:protein ImuB
VPVPDPAVVPSSPVGIEVLGADGQVLGVSGRGHLGGVPATVSFGRGPAIGVVAWAGPWPVDERWWDPEGHRRRARLQLQLADGRAVLVHVEGGRWSVEGIYD